MKSRALVLGIMTLLSTPLAAQSQWCYEGECKADCPHTLFALRYDWWWCSCPTRSECIQDFMQTCNRCVTGMLGWCSDPFDPYCHTYFLTGYDQFCGCQYGQAGLRHVPPASSGRVNDPGKPPAGGSGRDRKQGHRPLPEGGAL